MFLQKHLTFLMLVNLESSNLALVQECRARGETLHGHGVDQVLDCQLIFTLAFHFYALFVFIHYEFAFAVELQLLG